MTVRTLSTLSVLMLVIGGIDGQQAPATEVFLADVGADGVAAVRNISNSPEYDNQPGFLPDGRGVLFSSRRDGKQTDIYRYDVAAGTLSQVTRTPEDEYSPTVTPDGKTFSVVRVELPDKRQRLWRFNLDGSNPRVVLENVAPVGYHAWIDDTRLALFVLSAGQGEPNTLQLADTRSGAAKVVEQRIGRSLLRRPGSGEISYVHQQQNGPSLLKSLDPATLQSTTLVEMPKGSQDLAWLPDGTAILAQGRTFYRWRAGQATWAAFGGEVAGVGAITRIAVSPDGKRLAFVAEKNDTGSRFTFFVKRLPVSFP